MSVVGFHLTPGVQALGEYREDRPRPVARHREEVRRLQALVDGLLARGRAVHALGDSNFDGLRFRPDLGMGGAGRRARDPRPPRARSTTSTAPRATLSG